jgi:hypothetical protein
MSHHTWKHRFLNALHNKNWKKITLHEIVEYAFLGSLVTYFQGSWEGWLIGISGAFIIHMVLFEALDAVHNKVRKA